MYAYRINLLLLLSLALLPELSHATTADELAARMIEDKNLVVIDVRSRQQYTKAHIPGAINIPASLISNKKMPPFGEVVVYGDGIDIAITQAAVTALNSKPGISAQPLDGGFGAWQSRNLASTAGRGMEPRSIRQLTYQELEQVVANNRDAVLVDLRGRGIGNTQVDIDLKPLTEFFPGANVIRPPQAKNQRIQLQARADRLYILVDDGDGRLAEQLAQRLRAGGAKRVAILAGGQQALRFKGEPGRRTYITGGQP